MEGPIGACREVLALGVLPSQLQLRVPHPSILRVGLSFDFACAFAFRSHSERSEESLFVSRYKLPPDNERPALFYKCVPPSTTIVVPVAAFR